MRTRKQRAFPSAPFMSHCHSSQLYVQPILPDSPSPGEERLGLWGIFRGPLFPPALCSEASGTQDAGQPALPLLTGHPPSGLQAGAAPRPPSVLQAHIPISRKTPPAGSPTLPPLLLVKHTGPRLPALIEFIFPHVLQAHKANSPLMGKNSLLYLHDAHLIVGFFFFFSVALVPVCEMTSVWQALLHPASLELRQGCCPGDDYFKF